MDDTDQETMQVSIIADDMLSCIDEEYIECICELSVERAYGAQGIET